MKTNSIIVAIMAILFSSLLASGQHLTNWFEYSTFNPTSIKVGQFIDEYHPYPTADGYEAHYGAFNISYYYKTKVVTIWIQVNDERPGKKLGALKKSPAVDSLKLIYNFFKTKKCNGKNFEFKVRDFISEVDSNATHIEKIYYLESNWKKKLIVEEPNFESTGVKW